MYSSDNLAVNSSKEEASRGHDKTMLPGREQQDRSIPAVVPEDAVLTVAVLQENIAFLREQLAAKRYWYEDALTFERQLVHKLMEQLEQARRERERLKVALAQAIQECSYHNKQEDENHHTTSERDINLWSGLVEK
jgi:hypothetical protein